MNNLKKHQPRIKNSADNIKRLLIKWLIGGGMEFNIETDAIANEVLFSIFHHRADLLILSEHFHAIEIKGEFDNLARLPMQLQNYLNSFDKVSVVTVPKHLTRIKKIISPNVGLILVENNSMKIVRKASINKRLNKMSLLMFLDRNSLRKMFSPNKKNLSMHELREHIAQHCTLAMIRIKAYQRIRSVYDHLFARFIKEMGTYPIALDDIRSLCATVSAVTIKRSKGVDEV
jgi:hypothetical protein